MLNIDLNNKKQEPEGCLRCNATMVEVQNDEKLTLYKYGLMLKKSTEAIYYVCPECGYTEIRANNPHVFKKKK